MESNQATTAFSDLTESGESIQIAPVRVSGFFALLFGLLSILNILTTYFIPLVVAAFLCGAIAFRPSPFGPAVGQKAAALGMLLALFFGTWGISKSQTMDRGIAEGADQFATNWAELARQGEWEIVMELMNAPSARQNPKMPLKEFYANNPMRIEALSEFRERPDVSKMVNARQQLDWQISEPTKIYTDRGKILAVVKFKDASGSIEGELSIEMERKWDEDSERYEWQVRDFKIA